jgi:flagellar FliL protein
MPKLPSDGPLGDLNPLERDDQILAQETASAKAAQKVSLDLDDAPFLQDDLAKEVPAAKEPAAVKQIAAAPGSAAENKLSRKFIILGALGALAGLILVATITFWLIKPTAPPLLDHLSALPEQIEPPPPRPEEHYAELKPFWVAFDQGDEVHFLSLKLTLVADDPMLYLEIQHKTIILRDAAYYFLSNRPLPTVERAETVDALKNELLSVFNQHLSRPLSEVLIGEFLVQAW